MDFQSFVLAASTGELSEATSDTARTYADAVEFRLDLADEPLAALAEYEGPLPIIATNRVEWEGGEAADSHDRIETLRQVSTYEAVEAVDVELETIRRGDTDGTLGELAANAELIVSVHDFDRTPSESDCCALLEEALGHGDVGKLAVTASDPADVLPLLSATRTFAARGEAVATMAMGEPGRHSRPIAPLYGSRIGYAPVDPENATAPGQYDLATLAGLIDDLGGA